MDKSVGDFVEKHFYAVKLFVAKCYPFTCQPYRGFEYSSFKPNTAVFGNCTLTRV
jgi:hypothetical protein